MRPKSDILKENRSVVSHKTLEEMLEADTHKIVQTKKIKPDPCFTKQWKPKT